MVYSERNFLQSYDLSPDNSQDQPSRFPSRYKVPDHILRLAEEYQNPIKGIKGLERMARAVLNGEKKKIDELLRSGFDINTVMAFGYPGFRTDYADFDITQYERRHMPPDGQNDGWWCMSNGTKIYGTPLMLACRLHNPSMVEFLLQKGADPNIWIKFKEKERKDQLSRPWVSAYHCLSMLLCGPESWKRDADKIAKINRLLLAAGVRFPDKEEGSFAMEDAFGRTALWDAFEIFDPFWLEVLLKQKKYDPNKVDGGGESFVEFLSKIDGSFWNNDFALSKVREMERVLEKYGYKVPERKGSGSSASGGFVEVVD
ncbi:MAG: ankyrin repeat domain-containing protein [Kiritimatiellae bacterium]|nr:ankyrin repeat domain-containing protein [Kiritimatiellia bacterium]